MNKIPAFNNPIIMITIKHIQKNQISALNNPYGVDMSLNK